MPHPQPCGSVYQKGVSRRKVLTLSGATLLTGCGAVSTDSPFWATVMAAVPKSTPAAITPAQVNAIPYATILAAYEGAPKSLLVLSEVRGNRMLFMSASRQLLVTQGRLVVQTVGLGQDLRETRLPLSAMGAGEKLPSHAYVRDIDVPQLGRFNWRLHVVPRQVASEQVEILGTSHTLLRYEERVEGEGFDPYIDIFWLDARTGFCWRSVQRPHPSMDPLVVEVTRPAAV